MRLSTKGRYAVLALADLALHGGEHATQTLACVAERQNMPLPYLEQLFARLRRAGLVDAVRGPGGGYRLARASKAITIGEILRAADEEIRTTVCREGTNVSCVGHEGRCLAHGVWQALGERIDGFLASVSLAEVTAQGVPQTALDR